MRSIFLVIVLVCIAGAVLGADSGRQDAGQQAKSDQHVGMNPGIPDGREGGETIASAIPIPSLPFWDSGNTSDNIDDYDEDCGQGTSISPDVVYSYSPTEFQRVDIDLCGSGYDTKVYVYRQNASTLWNCNDDFYGPGDPCGAFRSKLENVAMYSAYTYFIVVDGYSGDSGDYEISINRADGCVRPNRLALSTSTEMVDDRFISVSASVGLTVDVHLLLLNPTASGVSAWKCAVDFWPSSGLIFAGSSLQGGGMNFATPPEFLVGVPSPLAPVDGVVHLATLQYVVTNSLDYGLGLTRGSSAYEDCEDVTWRSPMYLSNLDECIQLLPISGSTASRIFQINGDNDLEICPPPFLEYITVTPNPASVPVGNTIQFTAIGHYSDDSTVNFTNSANWNSSVPGLATIRTTGQSFPGRALGVAEGGPVYITASRFGVESAPAVLTVSAPVLESISLTPLSPSIPAGRTIQFTATGHYSDGSVGIVTASADWTSSDPDIASIQTAGETSPGLARGVDVGGPVDIEASLHGVSSPASSLTVTTKVLESIDVNPNSTSVALGREVQFTATGQYSDGSFDDITNDADWASNNSNVASIQTTGETYPGLALGNMVGGPVDITAFHNGITSNVASLAVTPKVLDSIVVTPPSSSVPVGLTVQFAATGHYSDGSIGVITADADWTSDNENVVTIQTTGETNPGLAEGVVVGGPVNIRAARGGVTSDPATLTVAPKVLESVTVDPSEITIADGTGIQFEATGRYSDGSQEIITAAAEWHSSNQNVATIQTTGDASPGLAHGLEEGGPINITATLNEETSEPALLTVTSAILVSIEVTPASSQVALGQVLQFTATGTYSDESEGNITASAAWSSNDVSVASVQTAGEDSPGLALGERVGGPVEITANLNGITSPGATLTVGPKVLESIVVTPNPASVALGREIQFTAMGQYSDGTFGNITDDANWVSNNVNVATIQTTGDANPGLARGDQEGGPVGITASLDEISSNQAILNVTQKELDSIDVTPPSGSVALGQDMQFTATGRYSDGTSNVITASATWVSSDVGIATIQTAGDSNPGLALGEAVGGPVNVTASLGEITSENVPLTVTDEMLVSIVVTPTSGFVALGQEFQFTATGHYSDESEADITNITTWFCNDVSIATVQSVGDDDPGLASGIALGGPVNITASLGEVTSDPAQLTVGQKVLELISVTPDPASIAVGLNQQFTATGHYSDDTESDITASAIWVSSDPGTATIQTTGDSYPGLATGVAAGGSVNITASLGDVTSQQAVLSVTEEELVSIEVTPESESIALGYDLQFTATGIYSDESREDITAVASWISDDIETVTIQTAGDGNPGLAQSIDTGGPVGISASYAGVESAPASLTVTSVIMESITVDPDEITIVVGSDVQFSATAHYSDGSTIDWTSSVDWFSSDLSVATIQTSGETSPGLALGVSEGGPINISASVGPVSSEWSLLTVTAEELVSIEVQPDPASLALGQILQFTATGHYTDSSTGNITAIVDWVCSDVGIASIQTVGDASPGLAQGVAVGGPVNITASLGEVSSDQVPLTVTHTVLESIEVTPDPARLTVGLERQFTATGHYSDGSTDDITASANWVSSDTGVATIQTAGDTKPGLAQGVAVGGPIEIRASLDDVTSLPVELTVDTNVLVEITLSPDDAIISVGQDVQFTATGHYSDESTEDITSSASWLSSDTGIVTIQDHGDSDPGLARGMSIGGPVEITATHDGVTSDPAPVTVTTRDLESISLVPIQAGVPLGGDIQFLATGHYSDESEDDITASANWVSSDISTASIQTAGEADPGLASGVSVGGPVSITASRAGVSSPSVSLEVVAIDVDTGGENNLLVIEYSGEADQITGEYQFGGTGGLVNKEWNAFSMTDPNNDGEFTLVIEAQTGQMARGLEYLIDSPFTLGSRSYPQFLSAYVQIPGPPLIAQRYRMVSAPLLVDLDLVGADLAGHFGAAGDDTRWRLGTYVASGINSGNYIAMGDNGFQAFEPGRAYWLITRDAWSWDLEGYSAMPDRDGGYRVTLAPGWNMVGNPTGYSVTMDYSQLYVIQGSNERTFAAARGDWVSHINVFVPNQANNPNYNENPGSLAPWSGFWIKNLTPNFLDLAIPQGEVQVSANKDLAGSAAAWLLTLRVRSGGESRQIELGLDRTGELRFDQLDRLQPPGLPGGDLSVKLFSPWDQGSHMLLRDVRPSRDDEVEWRLGLSSPEDMVLNWEQSSEGGGADPPSLVLHQEDTETFWDMVSLRTLSLPGGSYSLSVIAGDAELGEGLSAQVLWTKNWPNPFSRETTLYFNIPVPGNLRLRVYDIQGRCVWQHEENGATAGQHAMVWTGRDNRGQRLSSGVYFLRLESASRNKHGTSHKATTTSRLILLR